MNTHKILSLLYESTILNTYLIWSYNTLSSVYKNKYINEAIKRNDKYE